MISSEFTLKKVTNVLPGLEFDCGDDQINEYFHSKMYEDVEFGNSMSYLLFQQNNLVGFFTLSNSKLYCSLKGEERSWSAELMGQLGVQMAYQRKGYGSLMISLAKKLSFDIRSSSGCRVLLLKTYRKHLFEDFYKNQKFHIANKKSNYLDLFYDLNDWPREEPDVIQKWNLEI